jgi:glycosyltransferase involved in cell wall biosynthesis
MARKTLNILFLNSIEKTVWGGLENWMEISGLGLARRGHTIWFAGRDGSQFLKRISVHEELNVIPLDIAGDFKPATIREIADIARQHEIDLMLCNFVKDVRLAGMARKKANGFKIIWTPGVNLAKKSLSHRWLFSGFVDRAIVPSAHLRDAIVSSGYIRKSRFEVIPIGIDDTVWQGDREEGRQFLRQRYDLPDSAFICLTSGRFVKQKGHCYLVEAAAKLAGRYDDIFFLLLGDGPLQPTLLEQIKGHGLTDRFVFCGLLENHHRAVFGADLYVHLAIIEPYGIVLVEAMASSLPIVASRVGGIPEVVAENKTAILVNPADSEQLTKGIERFYNDSSMREKYGRTGFERFDRNFKMDTMIDRIEKTLIEAAS